MENASESIGKIALSLSKAQGSLKAAVKDATNPHLKSKYANIASVWESCREALTANEIAVIQRPIPVEQAEVRIETVLIHSSGEWISGTIRIPAQQATPQGFGSAITYARRYALMAMVGIAPDDDDDGEAAMNRNGKAQPKQSNSASLLQKAIEDFSKIDSLPHLANHWAKHQAEYRDDLQAQKIVEAKDKRKAEIAATLIPCPNTDGKDVPKTSCESCTGRNGCPSWT